MKRLLTPDEALVKATKYCAGVEHCIADVDKKLVLWMIASADRKSIISFLIENKFINETRYATAFAKDKAKFNGWGIKKIAFALKQKNIPTSIINAAIETIDASVFSDKLNDVLKKKYATIAKHTDKTSVKNKLLRFALSRGFAFDDSLKVVEQLLK